MGSYIISDHKALTDERYGSLPKNRTCMLRSNLSRTALVSQDARARPVERRPAVEAQISTEVLRQDESGSAVHHESGAGKKALPVSRRAIDRAEDCCRPRTHCRGTAAAVEQVS
jgi:hypothetical protein